MQFENGEIYYKDNPYKVRYRVNNIDSYICSKKEIRTISDGKETRFNQEIKILTGKVLINNNSIVTTYYSLNNPLHFNTNLYSIWHVSSNTLEMTDRQIDIFIDILNVINNEFECPDCGKRPDIFDFKFNCTWCGISGSTFLKE